MNRFARIFSTRRRGFSSLAVLALILVLAGCGGANGSDGEEAEAGPEQRRVRVETLKLTPTTFEDVIDLTGSVESLNDATLSAQSSGTLDYLADLGTPVSRGQAVARLDQGLLRAALQQAEAQVESAQAQLDLAQDNYNRQEPLYRDSIISALEFQNVRAQLSQARAQLRQAEAGRAQAAERLSDAVITAPFNGTVEEHFLQEGEQVSPGQRVVRVVSTDRVRVRVGVPEVYAGDVETGTPVVLSFKAYNGQPRRGTVTFAGRAIDQASRTFPVEIEVPNPDGRLKPEMIAEVAVTRETLEDQIVIPRAAVLRDEEGSSVFIVTDVDGVPTASRRTIGLGPSYSDRVVVTEGLEAGDEVIVLGQNNVTEGDAVDVVEEYRGIDASGVPLKQEPTDAADLAAPVEPAS